MSRREARTLIWEGCEALIRELTETSFQAATLPHPPLELPDFPAIQPETSEKLADQAVGIFLNDKAGFNHRLSSIVDDKIPDYVRRNIDPEKLREKWISENSEKISEALIFKMSSDWLSSALDESSPDTDRWYLGVSLLIGLSLNGSYVAKEEGFHLLISISMAQPPRLQTPRTSGPHHLAWNPSDETQLDEVPHPSGVLAASIILDTLSGNHVSNSQILPYWLESLTVSRKLSMHLNVPNRLMTLLNQRDYTNSKMVVKSAIQLISEYPQESHDILTLASKHHEPETRRELASLLQRISSDDAQLALGLMEGLLQDEDSDTRVLATTFLSSLVRYDIPTFSAKASEVLKRGDERMTQRIVDSAMREYLSINPMDEDSLLSHAWISSGESSKSRLVGLVMQQLEVTEEGFKLSCRRIYESSNDEYYDLKKRILRRDSSLDYLMPF